MKIGITGADGFLGWHVRVWLKTFRPQIEIRAGFRETFSSRDSLEGFCRGLDAIIHCAGVNRGEDAEVESGNIDLAKRIKEACRSVPGRASPRFVFANSIHIDRDSAYASGKRVAAEILSAADGGFCNIVLPNLFGEFGRPFYNSVVSTFCHQLATRETPKVHQDAPLHLLHAQRAAAVLGEAALAERKCGEIRPPGVTLTVREVLSRLQQMHSTYAISHITPDLSNAFDRDLFNTLRSYFFPGQSRLDLTLHNDPRGELFEAVKSLAGGQTFVSTTHPGIMRGNHYHTRKFERFVVCSGQANISLRRLFSEKVETFTVSGDEPCAIDMPTFCTHSIVNTGSGLLTTLFWANEIFNPADADTFSEQVIP